YDADILEKERDRVSTEIRDRGMYFFNRNYVTYEIDSNLNSHEVDVYLYVNRQFENVELPGGAQKEPENHHRYNLGNIYILTNYDLTKPDTAAHYDTTFYNGYYFLSPIGLPRTEEGIKDYVKKDALLRAIF